MPGEERQSVPTYSLVNFAEILFPCLEAVSPKAIVEVGAFEGDFTRELLAWAEGTGTRVTTIEPAPPPQLRALADEHPELVVVEKDSHTAFAELPLPDAIIIDGDHNYYTVTEELRLISERSSGSSFPLLAFHDVCWPHARRDTYYVPERIPEEYRQPLAEGARLAPGAPEVAATGLQFPYAAAREGGPRNGVLTALEDFVAGHPDLRLAVVPAYFGLGLVWSPQAGWAGEVAGIVEPWDRSAMLGRLEEARVAHLIDRMRLDRREALLRRLLNSRAFALAERLSKLRQRGEPAVSRDQIRRVLDD